MVQLMKSGNFRSESDTSCRNKFGVKLEIEDSLEEEYGSLNKRSKLSPPLQQQQWSTGTSNSMAPPSQYNPLDEPSPLGLSLRKSPSLLDLIQMRLSHGNPSILGSAHCDNLELGKKDLKGASVTGSTDKLKASNFAASLLKIGTWECVSRYEGDLVAKCYFAKHKLVWEVLDGGLKSKMEIQWSDIMALKANCPDNGPGTLDIVLARQPLFFKETNPQPRKHTLWQATSDFTGGQASVHRRHFLQCLPGLLSKHFEKLIQCDPRLNWLSQQPEIVLESPYFDPKGSVFEDPEDSKCLGFAKLKSDFATSFSGLRDAPSPSTGQTSSSKSELRDPAGASQEHTSRETPSPSSVMDTHAIEENGSSGIGEPKGLVHWDQFKVPGIRPSMSMSDLVNHIGNCISEQMTAGNPLFPEGSQNSDILEEITQYLLSDNQLASTSDEKSLMSRVNSLCCLLQKDATTVQNPQPQVNTEADNDENVNKSTTTTTTTTESTENKLNIHFAINDGESNDSPGCKQAPGMSRKDSLGDLLLHLPRIASLPQFLFNISEE